MGNFFSESNAAAIAAVGAIAAANGVIIADIHDTDLPAVKTDTADIRTDVTEIHDTDLPAVKTDTNAIGVIVTDLHDTDLPAVKTDTANIITGVGLIPTVNRGEFEIESGNDTKTSYTDILNLTGSGKLYAMLCKNTSGSDISTKIIIDGVDLCTISAIDTTGLWWWIIPSNNTFIMSAMDSTTGYCWINLDYKISLQIQMHGVGTNVYYWTVYYSHN